jgi:hypothetical protein
MDFVTYLVYKDYIPFQVGLNLLRTCIAEEHLSQVVDELVLRNILTQHDVDVLHHKWEAEEDEERLS